MGREPHIHRPLPVLPLKDTKHILHERPGKSRVNNETERLGVPDPVRAIHSDLHSNNLPGPKLFKSKHLLSVR